MQGNNKLWSIHEEGEATNKKLIHKEAQTLELVDKYFKLAIFNMFKALLKENCV